MDSRDLPYLVFFCTSMLYYSFETEYSPTPKFWYIVKVLLKRSETCKFKVFSKGHQVCYLFNIIIFPCDLVNLWDYITEICCKSLQFFKLFITPKNSSFNIRAIHFLQARPTNVLEMMKEWKNNLESDEESTTDQRDSRSGQEELKVYKPLRKCPWCQ